MPNPRIWSREAHLSHGLSKRSFLYLSCQFKQSLLVGFGFHALTCDRSEVLIPILFIDEVDSVYNHFYILSLEMKLLDSNAAKILSPLSCVSWLIWTLLKSESFLYPCWIDLICAAVRLDVPRV